MIPAIRRRYNDTFTNEAYRAMLSWLGGQYNHDPKFHVAETPVFFSRAFRERVFQACDDVIATVTAPDYAERAARAIPPGEKVPRQDERPLFLQLDFGVCRAEDGSLTPQLVEVQGFPSLYFFQGLLDRSFRRFFTIPEGFSARFDGSSDADYLELLRSTILNGHPPENVILLEVDPKGQTTRIDFVVACAELGISEVCISEVDLEDGQLYYHRDGKRTRVLRIFNRVIFDELKARTDLQRKFNLIEDAEVEWAGHPNWFFLISKFSLPFLDSPYVPETHFVSDLDSYPEDLSNYVLKPLYSFAGMGVNLYPTEADLRALERPEHYILQRKVTYAPIVETPDEPARVELRMMYLWPPDRERPTLVNNLVRLSKGEMIGVRYNEGKTWVGGTVGYFEP
ncbi:hypothetical protein CLV84_2627 [Neolewinella xylanilytica]|uniref:Circularly permuted ATP-grasp superfamily protein n=1 Tax=Neolewinella xylanilytica TaxID=1514080 RepID=A0A2S6I3I8_9BACT|nr:hypothetical protein [Neolewinella xylanilytica]PPK85723.1 hypothetical protein CLV84_2627 [Neolewinella xylanilytica]